MKTWGRVCRVCGLQVGTASLAIHEPQCYRKKLAIWGNTPIYERGNCPVDPSLKPAPSVPIDRPISKRGKPSPVKLSKNSRVRISGLETASQHNGKLGTIQEFNKETGRFTISLDDGSMIAVKPEKLIGVVADEQPQESFSLKACGKCERKFAIDRLATHEHACLKQKTRIQFNSQAQRLRGLEISYRHSTKASSKAPSPLSARQKQYYCTGRPNWRQQHKEFIAMLRSARKTSRPTKFSPIRPTSSNSRQRFPAETLNSTHSGMDSLYVSGRLFPPKNGRQVRENPLNLSQLSIYGKNGRGSIVTADRVNKNLGKSRAAPAARAARVNRTLNFSVNCSSLSPTKRRFEDSTLFVIGK